MLINDAIRAIYARMKKENTLSSYQDTLDPFGEKFGTRDAGEILPAEIREYLNALPVSESTRYLRFTHLKALFYAVIQGAQEAREPVSWENPCIIIKDSFPKPKRPDTPLSDTIHADMQTVFDRLRAKHRLIYELGTRGGLRVSEILKITPAALVRNGEACCVMVSDAKSGRELEAAVIPLDLCKKLWEYIEIARIGAEQRIFPMSRQTIWRVFAAKGCKPHDLRRYAALRAMQMGKNLKTIQGMLRHASPITTERYIGNLSPQALARELEGM